MAARRATGPDGREWQVHVRRFRLPEWYEFDYEPNWGREDPLDAIFAIVLVPLFWFVVPLARAAVELPVAAARSLFSSIRYVEATCRWPSELTVLWRTSKEHAAAVADEVARHLAAGYDVRPANAEYVSMTKPPGFDDLAS